MVTLQEHEEAAARGREALRTTPRALSARYDQNANLVFVELNTGYTVAFSPQRSQALHQALPEDLMEIEISFPGFGLYFPKLDEGVLVTALAKGRFGSDRWEAAWRAAHPLESSPYEVSEAPAEEAEKADQTEAA